MLDQLRCAIILDESISNMCTKPSDAGWSDNLPVLFVDAVKKAWAHARQGAF
jgi:hypothetical protein